MSWKRRMILICLPVVASCQSIDGSEIALISEGPIQGWIVDLASGVEPDDVLRAADDVVAGELSTEPLFPGEEDPELARIYVIRSDQPVSVEAAFQIGHQLQDLEAFDDATPDLLDHGPAGPAPAIANCWSGGMDAPSAYGWSLIRMSVDQAWQLQLPPGGKHRGEGVRICHPDTGWSEHVDLDADRIDKAAGIDLIDAGGDGSDPFGYDGNPGHGTATGSVLMSGGGVLADGTTTAPGRVTGIAPKAELVPIRAIKSVVQFLDSDAARAVNYSRRQRCDVVSMSLGGAGFFGLKKAIRKAEQEGMIVVAAAGNCVNFVVAPASYRTTVAAAATNANGEPWKGSAGGRKVTVSAPGEDVYVARRSQHGDTTTNVEPSDGTSFATTAVAGAAASWIAFHGRARLDQLRGSRSLHELFLYALGELEAPPGWNEERYGVGILNLKALLEVGLEGFAAAHVAPSAMTATEGELETLASSLDLPEAETRALLLRLFGQDDAEQLARLYGRELFHHALTRPDVVLPLLSPVGPLAPGATLDPAFLEGFSARFRSAVEDAR